MEISAASQEDGGRPDVARPMKLRKTRSRDVILPPRASSPIARKRLGFFAASHSAWRALKRKINALESKTELDVYLSKMVGRTFRANL